ncbi:efflux RND transporter periplasmic adaptor subunit [Candidatus Parcubacteria bacterium]|nr:MAG: efflux RND transporter periplasmic adaptor subunit [Candidatus Parcubacteria bacterium]
MKSKQNKKNRPRWIWFAGVIVLIMIALVAIRMREVRHVPRQELSPWALETAVVKVGTVTRGFPVLATITTKGEITVTGQIAGTIIKMGPREGVAVKAGDFLARIDTRELEDNIASLQAKLEAAKAEVVRRNNELEREIKLFEEGGSSETSLEAYRTAAITARNNVRSLERQISALKVRKEYGTVLAPADGVIAARLREPGDVCLRGHPIYRLTVAKGARVRVRLPQSIIEQISPGTALELFHGADTLVVKLNRIYPSVDALALGAAEADLSAPPFGLASGARVAGRVILEEIKEALVIPPDALIIGESTNSVKVFKVIKKGKDEIVKTVPVNVELVGKNNVAVQGALSSGKRVTVGHGNILLKLRDGDRVVLNQGGSL